VPDDLTSLPVADSEEQTPQPRKKRKRVPVYYYDASRSRFSYALKDLGKALSNPLLIFIIIKRSFAGRYEKTLLGPFWITISAGMTVGGLALLYGKIFGSPIREYLPYVACGIIVFGLVSSIFNGGAGAFATGAGTFNQIPIAKSVFAFRALGNAFLQFVYKLPVLIPAVLLVGLRPGPVDVLLALAGIALILWTGFWATLILGTIGLRFQDFGQLISAIMSAVFFFTPVFWHAERLREFAFVVQYNPFYHYLNIVRGPIIGESGILHSFIWAGGFAAIATVSGALTFGFFARRFSYWT